MNAPTACISRMSGPCHSADENNTSVIEAAPKLPGATSHASHVATVVGCGRSSVRLRVTRLTIHDPADADRRRLQLAAPPDHRRGGGGASPGCATRVSASRRPRSLRHFISVVLREPSACTYQSTPASLRATPTIALHGRPASQNSRSGGALELPVAAPNTIPTALVGLTFAFQGIVVTPFGTGALSSAQAVTF